MPLVEHSKLPAFAQLRAQGHEVLSLDRAEHQDIRELHIGFLNMMPDAALQATERQFIRLVGGCNRIAQFFVYPFSLPGLPRSAQTLDYIEQYYYYRRECREPLAAAGAVLGSAYRGRQLGTGQCGIYSVFLPGDARAAKTPARYRAPASASQALGRIQLSTPEHPLLREINTRFDIPHSRYNDISREQLEAAGLPVLVDSREGGVHLAASPDQFRVIYMQGHPEYDVASLLKEYRRELKRFASGELETAPPFPEHYFGDQAQEYAAAQLQRALQARTSGAQFDDTLEQDLAGLLDNTWGDTAKAVINNWLGLVYRVTNIDRKQQFMPGVDAEDPLGLKEK
jgi:homoserine O-succinyltransferase